MRRRVWLGIAAMAVLAIGAALALRWSALEPEPVGAGPENAKLVALGNAVYARHCAACHGGRLQGQANWRIRQPDGRLPAPPHDEKGHTWHHPDSQLFDMTKYGMKPFAPEGYESDMPAFVDVLTDEEIRAVLAFIKSTWPPRIRAQQERINELHRSQE